MAENQAYHHRVTAVGTDMAGSLSQPLSATSYEESPVYAALKENGTYHDANPYNPSSASRLLVMGRENGNPMPDNGKRKVTQAMRPSYHYIERSDVKAVHLGDFARKPRVTEPYMSTIS